MLTQSIVKLTMLWFITSTTKGGILADVMGLGKTITTLSLIKVNTNKTEKKLIFNDFRIKTCWFNNCPNHLSKQWSNEVKKAYPDLKVVVILNKTHHSKISYQDVIDADILLVTQQFLMNFKHCPSVEYEGNTHH